MKGATAVRAGAVFAVTLTALQILQEVVGAFSPRPALTALIALTAAAASFALDRLRQSRHARHEREALLSAALVCWPPVRACEADPVRLGVFPARRGAAPEYIPRSVDGPLRAAAAPGRLVVLLGEPRAGKSRTALAALAGDAWLLVPRDAEGLEALAAADPPADAGLEGDVVLWLDRLERFAQAIDADLLAALLDRPRPPLALATARAEAYDRLLAGPGDAGRAIAARAVAFELPLALDAAERAAAGVDAPEGLGAALAATGREQAPPPAAAVPAAAPDGPRRDGVLIGAAAVAAAGLAAIALVTATAGFSEPSLADRIDAIRSDATGDRRTTEMTAKADFHGSGEASYLFLFSDARTVPGPTGAPRPASSDELRIYDRRGAGLRERFRFQPDEPGLVFQHRHLGDLDGDGEDELIGGYGDPAEASQALMPFIIHWDEGGSRYRMTSLNPRPLADDRVPDPYAGVYAERFELTDSGEELTLAGHRVQDFAVLEPQRLVSALVLEAKSPSRLGRVALAPAIVRIGADPPALVPCRLPKPRTVRMPWTHGRLLANDIRKTWSKVADEQPCTPAE